MYALPVGRGQQYLSDVNRVVDEAIGGWKISAAGVAYSGFPETITGRGNNSNSYGTSRAEPISHAEDSSTAPSTTGSAPILRPSLARRRVSTMARAPSACPRQHLRHFAQWRSAWSRVTSTWTCPRSRTSTSPSSTRLGFRFDAFNAFNIVSYGNPDTGINDTNFGDVARQNLRSTERHLQFSARYTF